LFSDVLVFRTGTIPSSWVLVGRRVFPVKLWIFLLKVVQRLKEDAASYKTSINWDSSNDQNVNKAALPEMFHMSKEDKPKRTRSTKKVKGASRAAELEAKIAELEAKLANLSSQVRPSEARPPPPKPESSYTEPAPGEIAPAYAKISSTTYTGNKYYATRARLAYHPPTKQFRGTTASTTSAPTPASSLERELAAQASTSTSRGTRPAGMKQPEKKSLWKAKGASYEDYTSQEEKRAPPPPREEPKPRPAPSGPSRGTLPSGFKPAPKPEPKQAPKLDIAEKMEMPQATGEVAPAYATISSTGYTGNKYYATRRRLAYHPPNKQYTGGGLATAAAPAPEPKPKARTRGTLPAGFKP